MFFNRFAFFGGKDFDFAEFAVVSGRDFNSAGADTSDAFRDFIADKNNDIFTVFYLNETFNSVPNA